MKRHLYKIRAGSALSSESEGVNPIEGVANLADAMLILAVGAMLALIINWHVDINPKEVSSSPQTDTAVTFTGEDMTPVDGEDNPTGDDMKKLGTVYYDENTDTYYIIGAQAGDTADQSDGSTGAPG